MTASVPNDARTRTLLLRLPPADASGAAEAPDLQRLQEMLQRLQELAEGLQRFDTAVARGAADRELRRHADRIREARSHLQRAQALSRDAKPPRTAEGLELMKGLKAAAEGSRAGELALQRWLARPLPALAALMEHDDGAAQLVDQLLLPAWDAEIDVVLLLGADTPPLARELAAREHRRVIAWIGDDDDQADFPPSTFVIRSEAELAETLQVFTEPHPMRLVAKHLFAHELTADAQRELQETVTDLLERMVAMKSTMQRFGPLWSSQGLANLPHVAARPSIASLRGPLQGKPMVIVAPGPSLSKNIHLLRELKGRAIICTYSRAMKSLQEAGIAPDMVLVLDPLDLVYHFDGIDAARIEALVLGLSVNPGLYDLPAKRVFTFSGNSTIEQWIYGALGEDMFVQTSCSVATSALSMARIFGCDPVILVGQDLSFPGGQLWDASASDGDAKLERSEGGKGYSVAGLSENAKEIERSSGAVLSGYTRLPEVPGYHGGTVQTSPNFSWVRAWFEERALSWGGDVTLINSTEGGAFIGGMEHIPLADAIDRCPGQPLDAGAVFDDIIAGIDFAARGRTLLAHVEDLQRVMTRCNQLARQCLKLTRAKPTEKNLRKLQRAEADLMTALQPAKVVISLFGQVEILDAQERARTAKTLDENLDASRELFTVIRDAHEQAYPALERAAKMIKASL